MDNEAMINEWMTKLICENEKDKHGNYHCLLACLIIILLMSTDVHVTMRKHSLHFTDISVKEIILLSNTVPTHKSLRGINLRVKSINLLMVISQKCGIIGSALWCVLMHLSFVIE